MILLPFVFAFLFFFPADLFGQDVSVSTFERWVYPRGELRDPVIPPSVLYSGEGFSELRVSTIMVDPTDVRHSYAVVYLDGREPIRRVVRVGDQVGDYRIVEISPARVVATLRSLGAVRQVVLEPPRRSGS
jgi:hypothetical protein